MIAGCGLLDRLHPSLGGGGWIVHPDPGPAWEKYLGDCSVHGSECLAHRTCPNHRPSELSATALRTETYTPARHLVLAAIILVAATAVTVAVTIVASALAVRQLLRTLRTGRGRRPHETPLVVTTVTCWLYHTFILNRTSCQRIGADNSRRVMRKSVKAGPRAAHFSARTDQTCRPVLGRAMLDDGCGRLFLPKLA